jgi:hypothetical protein
MTSDHPAYIRVCISQDHQYIPRSIGGNNGAQLLASAHAKLTTPLSGCCPDVATGFC